MKIFVIIRQSKKLYLPGSAPKPPLSFENGKEKIDLYAKQLLYVFHILKLLQILRTPVHDINNVLHS